MPSSARAQIGRQLSGFQPPLGAGMVVALAEALHVVLPDRLRGPSGARLGSGCGEQMHAGDHEDISVDRQPRSPRHPSHREASIGQSRKLGRSQSPARIAWRLLSRKAPGSASAPPEASMDCPRIAAILAAQCRHEEGTPGFGRTTKRAIVAWTNTPGFQPKLRPFSLPRLANRAGRKRIARDHRHRRPSETDVQCSR